MGKALQIRQKAADSPQGLTARRWPALLALARKVQQRVRERFGVEIDTEGNIL